jgi:cytochrome b6-f complex iron-sulfur subunit
MTPTPAATEPPHGNHADRVTCIGRREFLRRTEAVAGGVLCGALPVLLSACVASRARYLTPVQQGDRLVVPRVELDRTGALLVEDPGSELPIYVHRATSGEVIAVSTRCGHRGCQVEPAATSLVCPCHGSEYTFDGSILQGPTERALQRYRVTSDATHVYIVVSGGVR